MADQKPNLVEIPNAEIFRAGDYGDKGEYTPEDLKAYAENYNSGKHEAPVTIDHKQSGPAFGWLKPGSVKALGEKLVGTLQVIPEFADTVKRGLFKKRSIELYREPKNIRAVTFLGAQPPEVKGMPDLAFSASDDAVHIDFQEGANMALTPEDIATITDAVATKLVPMIDEKIKAAMVAEDSTETETPADPNASAADPNAAQMACKDKQMMSELEAKFAEEKKARDAEDKRHADELKKRDERIAKIEAERFAEARDNRWKNAATELGITDGMRESFDALKQFDEQGAKTIKFGEKSDANLLDVVRKLLSDTPRVDFSDEITAGVGSMTQRETGWDAQKAEVKKLAKDEGIPFSEALAEYERRAAAKKGA